MLGGLRFWPVLLLTLAVASSSTVALAQAKRGGEFQINTTTGGFQRNAAIAVDPEGDFVVVWESYGQDGSGPGVVARRFGPRGTVQSPELPINSFTLATQATPVIASDAAGAFVVAWVSSPGQDGDGPGVFARRFDAYGAPQSVEFMVNTFTIDSQQFPDMARRDSGEFVVIWSSYFQDGSANGIFARRFDPTGVPQAVEFQVNEHTIGQQFGPAVAFDATGNMVIVWTSAQDGSETGIFARRFGLFTAVGGEFQVNAYTSGLQSVPDVAVFPDGDFVVAWNSDLEDGSDYGVFGRRFGSSGAPQGAQFQINSLTFGDQLRPVVLAETDGAFVAAWSSAGQDGSDAGVFVRRFDEDGSPLGSETQVNSYTPGNQNAIAMAGGGPGFVITWQSPQDGDSNGVFGQRFGAGATVDVDGDGAVLPLTDGLLVLRFLFGFTGNTLIAGAVNLAGCTRCTAPAIEAFLHTLQ